MEEPCSLAVYATLTLESWDDRATMENVFWIVTSWFRSLVVETSWFWSAGEPSKCFCQVHTFSLEKCVCFWVQKNQPCEAVLCEALSGVNGWKSAAAHKPWWEKRLQQLLHATKPGCLKTCDTEILSHLSFNSPVIFRRHWSKEPCSSCCIFLAQSTTVLRDTWISRFEGQDGQVWRTLDR